MIDVKTSKVLKAESVKGRTGQQIFDLIDELANSIEQQLTEKDQPKTPAKVTPERQPDPRVVQREEPRRTPTTPTQQKKGGSKTALYILGGAVLIGGGVAAALLLGGGGDDDETKNSTVTVTVNLPC